MMVKKVISRRGKDLYKNKDGKFVWISPNNSVSDPFMGILEALDTERIKGDSLWTGYLDGYGKVIRLAKKHEKTRV